MKDRMRHKLINSLSEIYLIGYLVGGAFPTAAVLPAMAWFFVWCSSFGLLKQKPTYQIVVNALKVDGFVKTQFLGWLSKKRQMRGAQISRNEAYLSTPQ